MSHFRLTTMLVMFCLLASGCDAARQKALETVSANNMRMLAMAVIQYADVNNGEYPETLKEAEQYCTQPLNELLKNPFTGDNPGYEYVKPEKDAPLASTILLYQMQNGKRLTQGKVAMLDGAVVDAP